MKKTSKKSTKQAAARKPTTRKTTSARKKATRKKTAAGKKVTTRKKAAAGKKATTRRKVATGKKATTRRKVATGKKTTGRKSTTATKTTAASRRKTTAKQSASNATGSKKAAGSASNGKAKAGKKLTAKELSDFRDVLIDMRNRLTGQVNSLRHDSLRRDDEVNTVEDGTDAFERQFALTLASSEHDVIFEIDEALRRIEDGTYGTCEMTGEPIERARLQAIPFTRYSIAAQSDLEKNRGPYRQSSVMRGL